MVVIGQRPPAGTGGGNQGGDEQLLRVLARPSGRRPARLIHIRNTCSLLN